MSAPSHPFPPGSIRAAVAEHFDDWAEGLPRAQRHNIVDAEWDDDFVFARLRLLAHNGRFALMWREAGGAHQS